MATPDPSTVEKLQRVYYNPQVRKIRLHEEIESIESIEKSREDTPPEVVLSELYEYLISNNIITEQEYVNIEDLRNIVHKDPNTHQLYAVVDGVRLDFLTLDKSKTKRCNRFKTLSKEDKRYLKYVFWFSVYTNIVLYVFLNFILEKPISYYIIQTINYFSPGTAHFLIRAFNLSMTL